VIERAYIHVAGPERSGKTTLVEAILAAFDGPTITFRCRRKDDLAESVESAPARDVELRRIAQPARRARRASTSPPRRRTAAGSSAAA
jgi:thymidylate kinase